MKPLIYLASPYSSDSQDIIEDRVRKVQTATAKLIEQGNLVFSPIVHSHPICDQVHFSPINTHLEMTGWTQYDHDFIDHCAEVWVLMLDGWDTSRGVSDEIAYAYAKNIPVRFVSTDFKVSAQTYSSFNPWYTVSHPALPHIRTNRMIDYTAAEAEALLKAIFGESESVVICDEAPVTGGGNFYSPPSSGLPHEVSINGNDRFGHPQTSLPDGAADREAYPMAEGLLYYFPNALAEVSKISKIGADQHLPGQPMHWARGLSTNHADKIIRHLIDAGKTDGKGVRHSAYTAWRALALLQEELEVALNLPLPKNARAND